MGGIWDAPGSAWDEVQSWSSIEKIGFVWSAAWAVGTLNEVAYLSLGSARYGTVAIAAGSAMLAVAVPLAVGYAASDMIAGQRGRTDYIEFLTGKVSPGQYWDAVTLGSMR